MKQWQQGSDIYHQTMTHFYHRSLALSKLSETRHVRDACVNVGFRKVKSGCTFFDRHGAHV